MRWKPRNYGALGNQLRSISIGSSSRYPNTRAFGELVAISTEKGVFLSSKNPDGQKPKLICSSSTDGEVGTAANTPPIICGAGVLIRLAQKIQLRWDPLPWYPMPYGSFCEHGIEGSPLYQGGLALSGREVFVANDGRIHSFEIAKQGGS